MAQFRNLRPSQCLFSTSDYRRQLSLAIQEARRYGDMQLVQILQKESGLLPNTATRVTYVPGLGELDQGIVTVIIWLNKHQMKTLSSCSGLPEDHEGTGIWCASGYIIFEETQRIYNWIDFICKQQEPLFSPAFSYFQGIPSLTLFFGVEGLHWLKHWIRSG